MMASGVLHEQKWCEHSGCGKEALCGIGVHLSKGIRGQWYCFEHYKERIEAQKAEAGGDAAATGDLFGQARP